MTKAFIEIQKGSKRKYELDLKTKKLNVDRVVPMPYPCAYGFIPKTLGEDGDHLDILVISNRKLKQGSVVSAKPIALLKIKDSGKEDNKIIAVANRGNLKKETFSKIGYFFKAYKPRKIQIIGWFGKDSAQKEIESCAKRYKNVLPE